MGEKIALLTVWLITAITSLKASEMKHIKIGFLPAMTSKERQTLQNVGNTYAGAITVALKTLQNDSEYDNFNFTYMYQDTRFDAEVTLKAIVDMYYKDVDVFFGPENSCVISAKLAAALNRPMIGFRCLDSVLSNKTVYPTFARTVPGTAKVTKSILALLSHYKWNSFSVVREDTLEWEEVSWTLGLAAKDDNIVINTNDSFPTDFKVFNQEHFDKISKIAKESSNRTRIYLFLGDSDSMVLFMKTLADYVDISLYTVIHIRGFNDIFDYESPPAIYQLTNYWLQFVTNTTDKVIDKSFRQLITLLHRKSNHDAKYQEFEALVRHYITQPPFDVIALEEVPIPISIYAAKLYDGVMLYAKAVKKLMSLGGDPQNGRELMTVILNSTYESIQQFTDTIDQNGDAAGAYSAVAMVQDDDSPIGWSVNQVGSFSDQKYVHKQAMSWLGDGPPLSEPDCGFEGCKEEPESKLVVPLAAVISCSVSVVVILLGVCYWRQYQQKKRIDSLLWKLDKNDIEIISNDEENSIVDANDVDVTDCTQQLLPWDSDNSSRGSGHTSFEHQKKLSVGSRPWPFLDNDEDDEERDRPELPFYCPVGCYKNMLISLKCVWNPPDITKSAKKQLHVLRELNHDNINKFVGACIDPPQVFIVHQYCERGSLEDVLATNRNLFLEDTAMQYSLIHDLVKGMVFIHSSPIGCHGNLKSTKCLVDSRFVLRIGGFGLDHFRRTEHFAGTVRKSDKYFRDRMWTAPELLRQSGHVVGTQKGDVYSFGVILHEILGMLGTWGGTTLDDRVIALKVEQGHTPVTRPNLSILKCDNFLKTCMEECWAEAPESRPDFKTLQSRKLKPLRDTIGSNILENMLERIEKYTKNLESLVDERTHQLHTEKRKTEKLLHRMLPRSVAEDLKRGKKVQASFYECVTIYFSDIVGFTQLCAESDPYQIVSFLNDLYTRFDEIINNYDVYKVETIGDAYMVVSGLPKPNGDSHAGEIASMSLHLLSVLKNYKIQHRPGEKLQLRIGIHSGPVVVGVVGIKMPRYCLFGDTVNTTSRMESNGLPSRVHCSEQCKNFLDKLGGYHLEKRGMVEMKGKGEVLTYWLVGEDSFCRIRRMAETVAMESACNSTRSSFDSLYLMPNGFRKPAKNKLPREHISLEEFRQFRPFFTPPSNSRKSIRRGSVPINDFKRGSLGLSSLEVNSRRGSIPINSPRLFDVGQGWELNEDDERKTSTEFPKFVRTSPEGCDSEPEADSRRASKQNVENNNNHSSAASRPHVNIQEGTTIINMEMPTIIVDSPTKSTVLHAANIEESEDSPVSCRPSLATPEHEDQL